MIKRKNNSKYYYINLIKEKRLKNDVKIKRVKWQSKEYLAAIELRNSSLNQPSGLTLISEAPAQEELALHLVALIKGRVVGTLVLDATEQEHVAQIKQVAVSADYRGRKIGQQLMTYAEQVARQQGYREIHLNARESAWLFYEKLGYHPYGEQYFNGPVAMEPFYKVLTAEGLKKGVA